MHKILIRQLRRLLLEQDKAPTDEEWQAFLQQVDRTYGQADQDRYLLERSLAISSHEMQELYATEQEQSAEALKESEVKYRSLFYNASDSIFIIEAATRRILDCNEIAAQRLGYERDELIGTQIDDLNINDDRRDRDEITQRLEEEGYLTFERTHKHKDGRHIPVEVSTVLVELQGVRIFQSSVRDISERKRAEAELQRLATHDPLTGLPNRTLLGDRLSQAIYSADRNNEQVGVLFLDLDGFKKVNDAFGHKQGDELLKLIGSRLAAGIRKVDTVARLGGDEFAIVVQGFTDVSGVEQVGRNLIQAVAKPFHVDNAEAFVTASIGISLYPEDGQDVESLIQKADRAMYYSKADGKNDLRFYSKRMQNQALERLEMGSQLRKAIPDQQLTLAYQPQVDSTSGQVVGIEALSRWPHPTQGLLLPSQFIPLAEETSLILPLAVWMLEEALRQVNEWRTMGLPDVRLAVNISEREINHPDFVERIRTNLKHSGFPAHLLELELSEKIIFHDTEKILSVLDDLHDLGVRLAVDDLGSGYSTLSQLAQFPFDTLKIDQKFAPQISSSSSYAAVVRGIATIAENLGVELVAEGVETEAQLEFYESLGCHHIQGWLFAQAGEPEGIAQLIAEGIQRPQMQMKLKVDSDKEAG